MFFFNLQINVFNIYGSGPSPAAGAGRVVAPGPDEDCDFCRYLYRKIRKVADGDGRDQLVITHTVRRLRHGQPAVDAVPDLLRGHSSHQRQQQ